MDDMTTAKSGEDSEFTYQDVLDLKRQLDNSPVGIVTSLEGKVALENEVIKQEIDQGLDNVWRRWCGVQVFVDPNMDSLDLHFYYDRVSLNSRLKRIKQEAE